MAGVVYLDPVGGIAGDMFSAAFLDAGLVDLATLEAAARAVVPGVQLRVERTRRACIAGVKLRVITPHGEEVPGGVVSASSDHDHGDSQSRHAGHHGEHDHTHRHGRHEHGGHAHDHADHEGRLGHHDHADHEHHHGHHDHDDRHGHDASHPHAHGGAVSGGEGHRHVHRRYPEVVARLMEAPLDPEVQSAALLIFRALAEAEAKVHGTCLAEVAFHEVGADDALVDVVCAATCRLLVADRRLLVGPIPLGRGVIRFSHGTMPLPAPATLGLLAGMHTRPGEADVEMTTPTGAAIARVLGESVAGWPALRPAAVGYGHGGRDTGAWPNTLRLTTGDLDGPGAGEFEHDTVSELTVNVDDAPPHLLAPALDAMLAHGALDAYAAPYHGKKGRMGLQVTVLTAPERASQAAARLMELTGSIGVRLHTRARLKLPRGEAVLVVDGERLRAKRVESPTGSRIYPEADEVLRLAVRWGVSPLAAAARIAREAVEAPA